MKRYLLIGVLLAMAMPVLAQVAEHSERDSILKRIDAMPCDSTRLIYEVAQQYQYLKSSFARDLLDRLYRDAGKLQDREKEMIALCGYYSCAAFVFDTDRMKKEMDRISEHAYKYHLYDYYFRCKRSYLGTMASNGNIEWAIDEAMKMKEEAAALHHHVGLVSAQIALGQAYMYTRNDKKVVETLNEALALGQIEEKEKLSIYLFLITSYDNMKQYRASIACIDKMYRVLDNLVKNDSLKKTVWQQRMMHADVLYADAYMKLGEYDSAKKHLLRSERYYTPTCFLTYFSFYHSVHAAYYAYEKKWDLCMKEMDAAIRRLGVEQPMLKQAMVIRKITYLKTAQRWREALSLYRAYLNEADSINLRFAQKQEKTITDNYRWHTGLIEQAQNAYRFTVAFIVFIVLALIVIAAFVIRFYVMRVQLRRLKEEAERSEQLATESNRLKEVLTKNILKELGTSTSYFITAVEQVFGSSSWMKEDVLLISCNAKKLRALIAQVLELSKLEVNAAEFVLQQVDMLSICHKAIYLANAQKDNKVEISFFSEVNSQTLKIDEEQFAAHLATAMVTPEGYELPYKLKFVLKYSENGQMILVDILGSPLCDPTFANNQTYTLQNQINRLFFESFGGKYEWQSSKMRPRLTISLPYGEY
ncbi:MAG: hypothetical protein RR365_12705 [Bacteroides sp.]